MTPPPAPSSTPAPAPEGPFSRASRAALEHDVVEALLVFLDEAGRDVEEHGPARVVADGRAWESLMGRVEALRRAPMWAG